MALMTASAPPPSGLVCSMCRKILPWGSKIVKCSVSTCNSGRIKLVFCSANCWDAHLPNARHRDAWFVEEIAHRE
jgi:LSD1 subclass zinc finger protein